ncbi:MAG: methyltransferase domain-containing protein [Patescibacteria group bacterium]
MYSYSKEFKELIKTKENVVRLLKGSGVDAEDLKYWEEGRGFIAKTIDYEGSVLDVGCGNGFLLKSLQEWTEHTLTPYGIDNKIHLIEECKKLFPKFSENFKPLNLYKKEFVFRWLYGLPKNYDFIYWNVWDNFHFRERGTKEMNHLLNSLNNNGKLILGFYDISDEAKKSKIDYLENEGYKVKTVKNPFGHEWLGIVKRN